MGYIEDRYVAQYGDPEDDKETLKKALNEYADNLQERLDGLKARINNKEPEPVSLFPNAEEAKRLMPPEAFAITEEKVARWNALVGAEMVLVSEDWRFGIPSGSVTGIVNNSKLAEQTFETTGEVTYGKGSEVIIQLNWIGNEAQCRSIADKIREYNYNNPRNNRISFEYLVAKVTSRDSLITAAEQRPVSLDNAPILAFLYFYPYPSD